MELNSLGTAREDTHGTPGKSRGKMHSLSFFVLPSAPYTGPTPSAARSQTFPSSFHRNLRPRPAIRRSSRFGIRLRTRVECLRLARAASHLPASFRPYDGWCKWARDAESCSFSSKYSPGKYIYMYLYIYFVYAFSRLR